MGGSSQWRVRIGTSSQKGTTVNEAQRLRWLKATTGEDGIRAIARKVGRSHTTVQRWLRHGIPHRIVWELTLRFDGDPVQACVVLGYVAPDEVPLFNYAAVAKYMPTYILAEELVERTRITRELYPHIKLQRLTAAM